MNECSTGKHSCHVTSSLCYNTIGSFGCACNEGYTKNGEDKCTGNTSNPLIETLRYFVTTSSFKSISSVPKWFFTKFALI